MIRLTTDDPQGNFQRLHNMTVIKDGEVFLKIGEGDISLVDYCKNECKEKCGIELDGNAETFGDSMDCDCIVAAFYGMAIGHAELRSHLKDYEDLNEKLPEIVCLCGSTKFFKTFDEQNFKLTLEGKIVLSIGCNTKSDEGLKLTSEDKIRLDELHKRKIDLCNYILVLNVDGYIGDSTKSEIAYAERIGKPVKYLFRNEYKNEDKKCQCWKCELSKTCPYKDKYQRLPRTAPGALGLCKKL